MDGRIIYLTAILFALSYQLIAGNLTKRVSVKCKCKSGVQGKCKALYFQASIWWIIDFATSHNDQNTPNYFISGSDVVSIGRVLGSRGNLNQQYRMKFSNTTIADVSHNSSYFPVNSYT